MSEFTVNGDGKSCQKKLAPPRSLQDADGRGPIVWDMISKRYPKAAPLLCEMETVIDRAQNLLRQLRSVHYDNEIGRSNSAQISYNDEFERQRSTSSVIESSSHCEEINAEVEEVGTRISYDRIPEMEDPSSSTSSSSLRDVEPKESADSTSRVPFIDVSMNTEGSQSEKIPFKYESDDRSNSTSYIEKRDSVRTKEVESLEGWDRVVGGKMMNSKRVNVKEEVSIGRQDRSIGSYENSTIRETTKSNVPSFEESTRIYEVRGNVATDDDTMREIESVTMRKSRKTETAVSSKRRAETPSDSSPGQNSTSNLESSLTRKEMEKIEVKEKHKMRSDDEQDSPKRSPLGKTPVEILNDYAAQNNEKIEFKVLTNKGSFWKIKCFFAGHIAEAIGNSKSAVTNELATKILRKLAEMQIDEVDMKNLTAFTDDQMRDIVALDTGYEPENAMRKLYKFCLEKNAPKPIYVVKRRNVAKGFEHVAECRALDKVGHGSAIRDENAKISAAEELYTKLRSENFP